MSPRISSDWLKHETDPQMGREEVTILAGARHITGTVLGRITASGKCVPWAPAATDGSQNVAGILYFAVNATAGDAKGTMITRDARVVLAEMTFPSASKAALVTALAALNIRADRAF
jgi:hypothetical protein